jgi:SagB-type dehydrogenase family enzyme
VARSTDIETVRRYHDGTKHHFHRFARSLGYLDWDSQPSGFRAFAGAPVIHLFPSPDAPAPDYVPRQVPWPDAFQPREPAVLSAAAIGDLLRHSLGLSAWKQFGNTRWSLRVNPSSGNLHPTEAYVVCGAASGLPYAPGVYHYAPDRHVLEQRCAISAEAWAAASGGADEIVLVALTSIHWREAWKYGERAFRYCQHDLGHAAAALAVSAAMIGWRAAIHRGWSHGAVSALTGVDRDDDFFEAEREEPGCVVLIAASEKAAGLVVEGDRMASAAREGRWAGRASQLSEDHVEWTFIDEVARATRQPFFTGAGAPSPAPADGNASPRTSMSPARHGHSRSVGEHGSSHVHAQARVPRSDARTLVLQRRSALSFDGRSGIDRATFLAMLERVMPDSGGAWSALWWTPRVHLVLFVHRVADLDPGLYLLARPSSPADAERTFGMLRAACTREFLWERVHETLPLFCLARGDCRGLAGRLSCDQEIAADGFFSLGMLAEFDASLEECGAAFYRNLFWETGVLGQMIYLEAEAAGARATGVGCFYDDPVHETLGLRDSTLQSLYHFTVGMPVEDRRLTSEPGYEWERQGIGEP